jgi:two-component system, chemotaxis family, sensor kinase CheA
MIPAALRQLFFDEAADLLREFEEGALGLEQAPEDAEQLNRMFRTAHTLKGTSAMLDLTDIARFTHTLENLLLRLRKRELGISPDVIGTLLRAGDLLRRLVDGARDGVDGAEDLEPMLGVLAAYTPDKAAAPAMAPATGGAEMASRATPTAAPSEVEYLVRFDPPSDLLVRGLDPLRILAALGQTGRLMEVTIDTSRLPSLHDMDPERLYLGFTCRLATAEAPSVLEACFDVAGGAAAATVERVAAGDRNARPDPRAAHPGQPSAPAPAVDGPERRPVAIAAEGATFRVSAAKVDRLVNLVGEISVTQSMVQQAVAMSGPDRQARLEELMTEMLRHCRELEERVMAIRMVPIQTVFGRFPRVVRDLATTLGKDIRLEIGGAETELDRTIIEQISDPLVHLVRNAVDHGIEAPAARRDAGKPASGRIALTAYQQSGSIWIEVVDDGRGLDRDRILTKARAMGLIAAEAAPADEDVFALIFEPGFSTAETVTEVSGRGVGLDVVHKNIRRLGGAISIQSVAGQGTRFVIRLPLTLASLDGQALRVGAETYVLPLGSIVESLRPRPETFKTVLGGLESLVLRGEVLPVLRLHRVFRVAAGVEDPLKALAVIIEHDGRRLALLVDELLEQQQVVIKSLDANYHAVDGIAGATIMGDGRVALILDVAGLIVLGRARATRQPSREGTNR